MRESTKAALGGIVSAMAVVIMLSTYLSPFLVYTAPPFAGLLMLITVNELGYKWSTGVYFTVSVLSIFLIADKESAVFYSMFFGYYPILSVFLQTKIKNKKIRYVLKLLIYNIAVTIAFLICTFVLAIDYDDFENTTIFIVSFVLLMNLLFVAYDMLVDRLQILYMLKIHKRFKKLFKR